MEQISARFSPMRFGRFRKLPLDLTIHYQGGRTGERNSSARAHNIELVVAGALEKRKSFCGRFSATSPVVRS